MIDTDRKITFITDYLNEYLKKVEILNKQGLFDSAKHFELFAIELARIWFGTDFNNCNDKKFNAAYIDLISTDKKIFVQVSTTKSIDTKINKTIKNVKESDFKDKIERLLFIFLDNGEVSQISQTEKFEKFNKDKDIINIQGILSKAGSDKTFCENLYNLVKKSFPNLEEELVKFSQALDLSRHNIEQINSTIGGAYEIDRGEYVKAIQVKDSKINLILGRAGSGKTVLGKLLLKDTVTLFARSELFASLGSLNEIWHFNFEFILQFLGTKKLNIFIDSLEFIADNSHRDTLLTYLLEKTLHYKNVKIYMTCRTSDSRAFLKINNRFNVQTFEIADLSDKQIKEIKEKFQILKSLSTENAYASLLNNPWYLNVIVENVSDVNSIGDENELRNVIWEQVVCKDKKQVCDTTLRRNTISAIIHDRAKIKSLYVLKDHYNISVVNSLISDGILIENPNEKNEIRAKFDIFEDIYFERYIDGKFKEARGDYYVFFSSIGDLGNCIYRRYQIWVSNKLWIKKNRDEFIFKIIFNDNVPDHWNNQTIIGIVKARHSLPFFSEYADRLVANNCFYLIKFIDCVNLYAFEIDYTNSTTLKLKPTGESRNNIMQIVCETNVYKDCKEIVSSIVKLISDWCTNLNWMEGLPTNAQFAKEILSYVICNELNKVNNDDFNEDLVISSVKLLYALAEISKETICSLWTNMRKWLKNGTRDEERVADKIIKAGLSFGNYSLTKNIAVELCELANFYWRFDYFNPKLKRYISYANNEVNVQRFHCWGLNGQFEDHSYDCHEKVFYLKSFIYPLLQTNFVVGLKFIISFINQSVDIFNKTYPNELNTFNLVINDEKKQFYGNADLWGAYRGIGNAPELIEDLLLCLEAFLLREFHNTKDKRAIKRVAIIVREIILAESNNIALLPIILSLGIEFYDILKEYALDLASNIDIVLLDLNRLVQESQVSINYIGMLADWEKEELKKHHEQNFRKLTLQDYIIRLQAEPELSDKVYALLDNLYREIPNDKEHSIQYLNIQKMDFRYVEAIQEGNVIKIKPKVDGEAKKVTEDNEGYTKPLYNCLERFNTFCQNFNAENYDINSIINLAEDFLSVDRRLIYTYRLNKTVAELVLVILGNNDINNEVREKYIGIMIDGLTSLMGEARIALPGLNEIFKRVRLFENKDYFILWKQFDFNLSDKCFLSLTKLIVSILIYNQGAQELIETIRNYLSTNKSLEKYFVNLLLMLMQEEMERREEYYKSLRADSFDSFQFDVNKAIATIYKNVKEDINIDFINESKISPHHLYSVCNLDLSTEEYYDLISKILNNFIHCAEEGDIYQKIDFYERDAFSNCLRRNMLSGFKQADMIINMMFKKKMIENLSHNAEEFYEDVLGLLVADYFDAYKNLERRKLICHIWDSIEGRVKESEEAVRRLNNCLIFTRHRNRYGSWEKFTTHYSYEDKVYINNKFIKYGHYDIIQSIRNIYILKADELLPEILISLSKLLTESESIRRWLYEVKFELVSIISKAFFNHQESIKTDAELTDAFEKTLESLVKISFQEAALLLDEFRVH